MNPLTIIKKIYVLIAVGALIVSISAFINKKVHITGPANDLFIVDTLARDLIVPWAIIFLPDKTMLFTERSGNVRILRNGKLVSKPAFRVKEVNAVRKMGLLGIAVHPGFNTNRFIYISYNYQKDNKALLRIIRYRFENDTLLQSKLIIENIDANANHTGSRLKFGPDKKLYITTGDADRPMLAQDLKSLSGKILRVNDDGSIPPDNPFAKNDTARKEIWTYGHRNTQGIDFQPGTGYLFNSEHGPSGGDEVNQINKGLNYGWPLIHHREIRQGMVSPILEYTPSIGPSEVVFYNSNAFPGLKGNLLLASLRGESIMRLVLDRNKIIAQEVLLKQSYGRLRALTVGPDGYIYFSTSQIDPPEGKIKPGYDMLLRLRPATKRIQPLKASSTVAGMQITNTSIRTSENLYQQLCASCHGKNLEGTEVAKSLSDDKWEYGANRKDIIKNIREGIVEKGMPAWEGALNPKEISEMAAYISAKK